jgi:hypothetical protein
VHFGIDMPQYWFDPLGGRFGLGTADICSRVEKVVLEEWGVTEAEWDDDQRRRHRYLDSEATHHSHGSYPRSDDLRFYLSYHAMLVVAGQLLAEVPLPPAEDEWDTFQHWLQGHSLSRLDGGWLADRRDPEPLETVDWPTTIDHNDWRWTVSREDFDKHLSPSSGMVIAAGRWTTCVEPRREEVEISSALVSAGTARALLRARQTSTDFRRDPPLPTAGRDQEIQEPAFHLTGWVVDRDRSDALDRFDPWAADIHFPQLTPAPFVREQLKLVGDKEQRFWSMPNCSLPALISRVWASDPADRRDDREVNHGRRLEIEICCVKKLLESSDMCLIFEVAIQRRLSSTYQRSEDDDSVKYPPPYTRYYLLGQDGKFATL